MSVPEAPFRRLLLWYPRQWRADNGDVLVAILIEAAEHDGRTEPTLADVRGAVVHGTAARLTARLALLLSVTALTLSGAVGAFSLWAPAALANAGVAFALPALTAGVIPLLVSVAAVAVVRDRGLIGDGRGIVVLMLAAPALASAGLAAWSWGVGFDAADAGSPAPVLARAWVPLMGIATVLGVAALSLFIDSLLSRTGLARPARLALAFLASGVLTPIIGFALLTPYLGAGVALVTAFVAATPRRSAGVAVRTAPRIAGTAVRMNRGAAATVRALALLSVLGGALGVAYALTGSQWSPGADDGTEAMAHGITLMLVSAFPLLAAFGIRMDGVGAHRPLHVWGPLALLAGALGCLAAAYTRAPNGDEMAPLLRAGSVLAGAAISLWIMPRVRLPRAAAIVIGIFAGLLYAAFLGMSLTPLLAFAVPVLGGVLLFVPGRMRDQPIVVPNSVPTR